VTSRLLAPDSGAEIARFGIAQRLLFRDQLVTMPGGTPVTNRASDLLLGAAVTWTPQWMFDTTVRSTRDRSPTPPR
jgi:LPS-assembly protein